MGDELATSGNEGRFTLAAIDDKKRQEIIKSLASGTGIVRTAEECGVSHHTVEAVRDKELDANPRFANAYYQSRMGAKLLNIASKGMDMIDKKMEQIPAGMLGVTVGIAIDKFLALSGQASSIVEHRHSVSLSDATGPAGLSAGKVVDV